MTRLDYVLRFLGLTTILVASISQAEFATAQSTRSVTASARCLDTGGQPEVEVTVTNQTGDLLTVSYVHGFTTGQSFVPLMRVEPPVPVAPTFVGDGETVTLRAPWDDLGDPPGFIGGALVVTSAGALVPVCSERPADADELVLGPAPTSEAVAQDEAVNIAVEMLGRLESWRAYPALYQLLHPDAQAVVPFEAMACWYAERYGLPSEPLVTLVFDNAVDAISFAPWTWQVSGATYPNAAAVDYRQTVGTIAQSEEVATSFHLVEVDGQWRWFFGVSRDALAALPTTCDLGGVG